MKKNISDEIICPCCGEKIYRNKAETKESFHGCYKICYKCEGRFSRLSPNINSGALIKKWSYNLFVVIYFILALMGLYYATIGNESAAIIIGMIIILLLGAPIILVGLWCVFGAVRGDFGDNRKNLNESNNGFLPIFYSPGIISVQQPYRHVPSIVPFVREDQLDIGTRELTDQDFLTYFAVLLPKPNIKASISHIADIDKIKLNDMYKIDLNGNNIYLILADYLVNDNDITLMLKCFDSTMINTIKDHGGIEIQTLDNEFVGKAQISPI